MTCAICGGRGYTTRDHAYWQDGATQYETVEDECPCVSAPDSPSYDDLDAEPETAIGVLAVDGLVPDARGGGGVVTVRDAEPTAITIAGVTLTLDTGRDSPWWHGENPHGEYASLAWRYTNPTDHCVGQYGCSIHFGPACVGGVAPTIEALDTLVRERIEEARLVFVAMPVAP